jgi:hypothetical protein
VKVSGLFPAFPARIASALLLAGANLGPQADPSIFAPLKDWTFSACFGSCDFGFLALRNISNSVNSITAIV